MPHTVRDVATLALRKLGVLRAGGVPTAADAEEARASLISWYMEQVTGGAFGRVYNVLANAAGTVTPHPNIHVNINTEDAVTVDLPATVPYYYWDTWMPDRDYGWGLNIPLGGDNGENVPRDKGVVIVSSRYDEALRATYIYDGTVQKWFRVDSLTLTDEAPLSARGVDGLASVLALRMSELFGSELASPVTVRSANRYSLALVTNHGNPDTYGEFY